MLNKAHGVPFQSRNVNLPVYPKAFVAAAQLSRERDRAFVAMPFEAEHSNSLWKIVHGVCDIRGLNVRRADTSVYPNPIVSDILDELERAEIVLADLTGLNPNVVYEVGIAHVRCDSVILLAQHGQRLPFDLASIRCIFFDLSTNESKVEFAERLGKALDALRVVGPPIIIDGPLERTKLITQDLQTLANEPNEVLRRETVWFSGFLSSFAISRNEPFPPEEAEYQNCLLGEGEALLMLGRRGCRIRCIITPPGRRDFLESSREYATARVARLLGFLESGDECLKNIDWVISPFRQKNFYIIGHISYFEGYKKGVQRGYNLTLRQTGSAVNSNISLWETLFERLVEDMVPGHLGMAPDALRKALREEAIKALRESKEFLEQRNA